MKTLILALMGVYSISASAVQLDPMVTKSFRQIEKTYQGGASGGGASVGQYNLREFSVEVQIDQLLKSAGSDRRGKTCGREIAVGRTRNLEDLAVNKSEFNITPVQLKLLNDLYRDVKLKTMISAIYNGEGDAQDCAIYEMRIFANDGQVLVLVADYTH